MAPNPRRMLEELRRRARLGRPATAQDASRVARPPQASPPPSTVSPPPPLDPPLSPQPGPEPARALHPEPEATPFEPIAEVRAAEAAPPLREDRGDYPIPEASRPRRFMSEVQIFDSPLARVVSGWGGILGGLVGFLWCAHFGLLGAVIGAFVCATLGSLLLVGVLLILAGLVYQFGAAWGLIIFATALGLGLWRLVGRG